MGKRVAWTAAAVVVLFVGILVGNTWRIGRDLPARGPALDDAVDGLQVADRLAGALKIGTVSHEDPSQDDIALREQLVEYLAATWPKLHGAVTRERVRGGLLYTWKGSDPSLPSVLFAAHMDVVPPGTGWTHPPFEGAVLDGFVWGRGALDDKGSLVCILEAAELLLAKGFRPRRTLYLAFGGDEEVGGLDAAAIAALLAQRGVKLDWALDEGLMVTEGIVREIAAPVAPIGVGEKGYMSVQLTAQAEGGHASMPPRDTAVSLLAAALDRITRAPAPAKLEGTVRLQISSLAPYMPFAQRIALGNLWLFSTVVANMLEKRPAMNASLRTTLAPTIVTGGDKDNVLPVSARAVLNARILPGETMESVLARLRNVVADSRIAISRIERGAHDPPPLSPIDSEGYRLIESAIGRAFPRAVIVPALVLGATDGRHYRTLANGVYRWAPFTLAAADLARLHGVDERVKVAELPIAVRAYMQLMREAGK
jgi:carboxypeptidase PM20D1